MGKTDGKLVPIYREAYNAITFDLSVPRVACLGFRKKPSWIKHRYVDCYDKETNGWDINHDTDLNGKYDVIVCTRTAYFSSDPESFLQFCHRNLADNGRILVDWGLGDHWRYDTFKIGWVKNGEVEQAYFEGNFLWSTMWEPSWSADHECQMFLDWCRPHGYRDLSEAIYAEVPHVMSYDIFKKYFVPSELSFHAFWPEAPQLYILSSGIKNELAQ